MITPVLLCGGSGTRLWPLSRKSFPKQFTKLTGQSSLFQETARRISGGDFRAPVVVTNNDFRFIVTEQLQSVEIDPGAILIEPDARNTAPAILAATLQVAKDDPDGLLLVSPTDHVIPDVDAFHAALARGKDAAKAGQIVTFGVAPTRPETGYGYLELSASTVSEVVALKRFVEKPDAAKASAMLQAGGFLWNAGIFLFSAKTMLAAFEAWAPDYLDAGRRAIDEGQVDLGFLRLDPDAWAELPADSIDYAVMEKADNLSVVPYAGDWSDLGDWASVGTEMGTDDTGVAASGPVTAIDCTDTVLRAESGDLQLVGLGLEGLVVVAMSDAVLVADKSRAQDVKLAVDHLKARNARQATQFPRDHRPWGHFETLALSERFQVKRIVVKPGAALSLQSHHHRSEHWIVVQGTAKVTLNDEVRLVTENQSIYIPLGARHRMENPGMLDMVLIEVQTGAYLGEDDIVRYEDIYARK